MDTPTTPGAGETAARATTRIKRLRPPKGFNPIDADGSVILAYADYEDAESYVVADNGGNVWRLSRIKTVNQILYILNFFRDKLRAPETRGHFNEAVMPVVDAPDKRGIAAFVKAARDRAGVTK